MGWSPTSDDRAMRWRSQSMKRKNPGVDAGRILVDGLHGGYRVRTANGALIVSTARGGARVGKHGLAPVRRAKLVLPCRTSWFRLARTHFTPPPISQGTTGMYEQLALYIDGEFLAGEAHPGRHQPGHARSAGPAAHATEADRTARSPRPSAPSSPGRNLLPWTVPPSCARSPSCRASAKEIGRNMTLDRASRWPRPWAKSRPAPSTPTGTPRNAAASTAA